jgi:predicted solute-binding protein
LAGIRVLVARNLLVEEIMESRPNHKKRLLWVLAVGVLVLGAGGAWILKAFLPPVGQLACSKAMDQEQAQKLWDDSQEAVQKVRSLQDTAGTVIIELDTERCPGKAFAHIMYDTEQMRQTIQKIIIDSDLRQLPVEYQNV